jgi:ATP-dependent protease ClpP protease subunit
MSDFFSKLNDEDFFSDKLQHIYFNSKVTDENIDILIEEIREANKIITVNDIIYKPKPILLHISSYGGNLIAGIRLLSIFQLSKVPIATIIDNYSCSAATFLSINSPYRIMNKYGFCLIHEYTLSGYINKKRQQLLNSLEQSDTYFNTIIEMYKKKTKLTQKELVEILQHNLILDYKTCLEKGIVDRVIEIIPTKKNKKILTEKVDIKELLTKTDYNNLIISCKNNIKKIDKIVFNSNLQPVIVYPKHYQCDKIKNDDDDDDIKDDIQESTNNKNKQKSPINDDSNLLQYNIFYTLNLIPRIQSIKTKCYGIIDGPISIDDLLPLLYCDKIYMFEYSYIVCNLLYFYNSWSILLDDNVKNTNLLFNLIKNILKEKTKMSLTDINNINSKFVILNAEQAKKMGICHEIIKS